jgi:hypothetical protein
MRRFVVLLAVASACLLPAAASAEYEDAKLAEVASVFAMQPVTVECATADEDWTFAFAWGYVDLGVPVVHVDSYLCDAIVDVNSKKFGAKRKALAVLVLVHEAYHLRESWAGHASESETQCKAIRHVRYAAQFLGASYEFAMRLRDLAVGWHDSLGADHPEYSLAGCKAPRSFPLPSPDKPPRP